MPKCSSSEGREKLIQALTHLRLAINLLDQADAPPHIAAHVDLASYQLVALTGETSRRAIEISQIDTNADPH